MFIEGPALNVTQDDLPFTVRGHARRIPMANISSWPSKMRADENIPDDFDPTVHVPCITLRRPHDLRVVYRPAEYRSMLFCIEDDPLRLRGFGEHAW